MPFNSGVIVYFFLVIGCISWGIYETYKQNSLNRLRLSFLISVILVGLPFISSKIYIGILISAALAIFLFYKKQLPVRLLNMVLVSVLVIFIGYSSYALIVIRSSANTPMDQNSPEDVFALGSYLNREQYGDRPLFYGQTFVADVERKDGAPLYEEGAPVWARVIRRRKTSPTATKSSTANATTSTRPNSACSSPACTAPTAATSLPTRSGRASRENR